MLNVNIVMPRSSIIPGAGRLCSRSCGTLQMLFSSVGVHWRDRANHLCFLVCAFSYETCGEFELSSSLQHNYSLSQTCLNLQLLSPKAMMRDVLMHLPGLGRDGSNVHNMLTNLFSSHQLMSFLAGVSVRCELLSA